MEYGLSVSDIIQKHVFMNIAVYWNMELFSLADASTISLVPPASIFRNELPLPWGFQTLGLRIKQ
jgi:hypothetical protein